MYIWSSSHNVLCFLTLIIFSGWKRASPTSRRASTGGRTWSSTWRTTTSATGCGRRSSSGAKQPHLNRDQVLNARLAIALYSPAQPCRPRRRSRFSTTSLTRPHVPEVRSIFVYDVFVWKILWLENALTSAEFFGMIAESGIIDHDRSAGRRTESSFAAAEEHLAASRTHVSPSASSSSWAPCSKCWIS